MGNQIFFFYASPTLCRVDIVSRVDHYYHLSLGPTLLPIVILYIAAALMASVRPIPHSARLAVVSPPSSQHPPQCPHRPAARWNLAHAPSPIRPPGRCRNTAPRRCARPVTGWYFNASRALDGNRLRAEKLQPARKKPFPRGRSCLPPAEREWNGRQRERAGKESSPPDLDLEPPPAAVPPFPARIPPPAARCSSPWRIPAPRVSISSCAARLNQAGIESRHPAMPVLRSSIGGFDARNQQLLCSAPASHPRSSLLPAGRLQPEVCLSNTPLSPSSV